MAPTALVKPDTDTISATNLTRLLSRLDQKLSSPLGEDGNLRTNSLEQAKATANLEYARQLLHKLETSAVATSAQSKQQETLAIHRQTIKRLNESLHNASQIEETTSEGEGGESDELMEPMDDDYARLNSPKPKLSDSITTESTTKTIRPKKTPLPTPASTLRNRFASQKERSDAEKRQELLGSSAAKGSGDTAEKLLDKQRQEQEDITGDLLEMAKKLKESSMEFGKNLQAEKGFLDQAKEGLDKNSLGMQSAGKKIENLRKNDNVSFYWSIIYIAMIVGLAFLVLFILFFAPKLRW